MPIWTKFSEECFWQLVKSIPQKMNAFLKPEGVQCSTSKMYLIKRQISRSVFSAAMTLCNLISSLIEAKKSLISLYVVCFFLCSIFDKQQTLGFLFALTQCTRTVKCDMCLWVYLCFLRIRRKKQGNHMSCLSTISAVAHLVFDNNTDMHKHAENSRKCAEAIYCCCT